MGSETRDEAGSQDAQIERLILDILRQKTGLPVQRADSLGLIELDSLALAEVSLEIEKSVGLRLDEGVLEAQTVGDIVDYVTDRKRRLTS